MALPLSNKRLTRGTCPRASLNLILAARARAVLNGRFAAGCDDVAAVAPPVLRHWLALNYAAQSESVSADELVRQILTSIPKDVKLE